MVDKRPEKAEPLRSEAKGFRSAIPSYRFTKRAEPCMPWLSETVTE